MNTKIKVILILILFIKKLFLGTGKQINPHPKSDLISNMTIYNIEQKKQTEKVKVEFSNKIIEDLKPNHNLAYNTLKIISCIAILILITHFVHIHIIKDYNLNLPNEWWVILIALGISFAIPIIIKVRQYFKIQKSLNSIINYEGLESFINKRSDKKNKILNFIITLLLSPDYLSSKYLKENIKKITSAPIDIEYDYQTKEQKLLTFLEKETRKRIIILNNRVNLSISLILLILCIIVNYLDKYIDPSLQQIMMLLIFFRIFHRSFEVVPAFYLDVVQKTVYASGKYYKNSNLKKGHRIYLGIYTIIEISILNALFYFMIQEPTICDQPVDFFSYLFHSISVSQVSNVSFDVSFSPTQQIIHVLQNTVTLIIVVFSIAYYMGNEDKYSEHELEYIRKINKS